jgi:hypothetical protein
MASVRVRRRIRSLGCGAILVAVAGCAVRSGPVPGSAAPATVPGASDTAPVPPLGAEEAGRTVPFGILALDLGGDSARQTIVDREPGQYLGHPSTVLLGDGRTILAVYPKGHGAGPIVMKRSTDGGRTWSGRLPVPDNWATSQETPTIFRVATPAGRTRLLLFSGLYPIRLATSDDDGATWTPLAPIGAFGGIVAMSSLVPLADGALMALFHDDNRYLGNSGVAGRFRVYETVSTDGGLTWSAPDVIADDSLADLSEPGFVRSPDGRQIAVLLRENRRRFTSFVVFSGDEGRSWSRPRPLPRELTGDRHVARYAPDGRLVVTFRDMAAASPTRGDWVLWVGTYDDLLTGGRGQYRVRLMDNAHDWDCGYAGLEVLPDGVFVATSYGHWQADQEPYIVSVRFRLPELDRLAQRAGGP